MTIISEAVPQICLMSNHQLSTINVLTDGEITEELITSIMINIDTHVQVNQRKLIVFVE